MARKTSIAALVVGLIVATSFVGAAAFTSATVERDVTVDIAADNNAIIELQDGGVDAVDWDGNQLKIYPDKGEADGLNVNATFTYGDNSSKSDATNKYAFNITNRDDIEHTFNLTYSQSNSADSTLTFWVVHQDDSSTATVTDESSGSITLDSDETAYVVVIVDSGTGTTNIEGTLTISVNAN